jgi:hypothetical protein
MLCSLGHDDIQYWLMQKENRTKILKKLRLTTHNKILYPMQSYIRIEERFKPNYEPEIFIDLLENRFLPSRKHYTSKFYWIRTRTRRSFTFTSEATESDKRAFNNMEWSDWSNWKNIGHTLDNLSFEKNSLEETLRNIGKGEIVEHTQKESEMLYEHSVCAETKYEQYSIVWEIKPSLDDLGQTLRQLMKYKDIVKPNHIILIYNSAKAKEQIISAYFSNQGVYTYRLLPAECERLELLKGVN